MPYDLTKDPQTPEEYQAFIEEWNKILEEFNDLMQKNQAQQSQQDQSGPSMSMDMDSLLGGGSASPSIGGGTALYGSGPSSGAGGAGIGAGAGGGGSAAGSSAGGMGAAGWGAVFAAIAAGMTAIQRAATRSQDQSFEGQESGGYPEHSFFTEPWYANLVEKMDLGPTSGERMDAAIKNKDWGKVARRAPAAIDYWADPIRHWLGSGVEGLTKKVTGSGKAGKVISTTLDPLGGLLKLIGK